MTGLGQPLVEIRREVLQARKALDAADCLRRSDALAAKLLARIHQSIGLLKDLRVALYRAMPGEVQTDGLARELRAGGARLFYPRIPDPSTAEMELVEMPEGQVWATGAYGIAEPPARLPACDPAELDLIVVPGVAFGPAGERLGLGKGFYDRLLPKAPKARRVALAFDFQLRERLEQRPWDVPVHWVLAESSEFG